MGFGLALGLSIGLTSAIAAKPSFDCSIPVTATERLICETERLSWRDEQLSAMYQEALKLAPNAAGLRREQREWLMERDRCQDVSCLDGAYYDRWKELAAFVATQKTKDDTTRVERTLSPKTKRIPCELFAAINRIVEGWLDVCASTPYSACEQAALSRGIEYHNRITDKYQTEVYPTLPQERQRKICEDLAGLEAYFRERRRVWEIEVDKEGSDFYLLEKSEDATEATTRAKLLTGCQ